MRTIIVIGLTPQGLSVLRTLSRAGHNVIALYQNDKNVGVKSKYGTKKQFTTAKDLKRIISELVKVHHEKLLCYITSGEMLAMILREYKELYNICDVIAGPYDTIEKLAHKDIMYEIATAKGFNVAKYTTLDKYKDGDLVFPIFIKRNYEIPLFFKAAKIRDKKEFSTYLERIKEEEKKDIILQEFINIAPQNLTEITAQGFFCEGELKGLFIANQKRKLKKGLTAYLEEINDITLVNNIKKITCNYMHELKYTGFAEFEFMYDSSDTSLYFIEINTRPCGTHSALVYKWNNLDDVIVNPHNAPTLIPRSNKPIKWMNITRDIRVRIEKKDFRNLFDIFRSKYDIFNLKDIKPFISQFL